MQRAYFPQSMEKAVDDSALERGLENLAHLDSTAHDKRCDRKLVRYPFHDNRGGLALKAFCRRGTAETPKINLRDGGGAIGKGE